MSHDKQFAELSLDEQGLHTPAGIMEVGDLTRAEFVRDLERDGAAPSSMETSAPAVAGGALLGGALLGAAGAVAGGLLGSTVKEEVPGAPRFSTKSVKIFFETADLSYSRDIARNEEMAANDFVNGVRKAMKHSKR